MTLSLSQRRCEAPSAFHVAPMYLLEVGYCQRFAVVRQSYQLTTGRDDGLKKDPRHYLGYLQHYQAVDDLVLAVAEDSAVHWAVHLAAHFAGASAV